MKVLLFIILSLCIPCVAAEEHINKSDMEPCLREDLINTLHVSLVELIVNSEDLHNKCVLVIGKLDAVQRSSALFMNNDDRERQVMINSISLSLSGEQVESLKIFNGRNFKVVGRFKSFKRNKHIYRGAITDITYIKREF